MSRGGDMDEIRALRHQRHRNQPVDPQGNTGPEPCAEGLATEQAPKGAKRALVRATNGSLETQMAGKPSYSRPHADRTSKSTSLGPEGDVRHSSELAGAARREEALEGSRTPADGPRAKDRWGPR